jgi:hypothetical protein
VTQEEDSLTLLLILVCSAKENEREAMVQSHTTQRVTRGQRNLRRDSKQEITRSSQRAKVPLFIPEKESYRLTDKFHR